MHPSLSAVRFWRVLVTALIRRLTMSLKVTFVRSLNSITTS
jgi:hypothetical protein